MAPDAEAIDTSKPLGLSDILSAADFEVQRVEVPQWGGHVHVRTLTGRERDAIDEYVANRGKGVRLDNFRVRLVQRCLCDPAGKRLMGDSMAELDKLGKKAAGGIKLVFDAASELNGIDDEAVEEAGKD